MSLWGATDSDESKPKNLTTAEKLEVSASAKGWVREAGTILSGNDNASATPEVLVALRGLAVKLGAADITEIEWITTVADKSAGVGLMGSSAFSGGLGSLLGGAKLARSLTPIGSTMTAAGLGKDYYEFAQDEIDKMNQMSDYDRRIYNEMLMDDTNIDF